MSIPYRSVDSELGQGAGLQTDTAYHDKHPIQITSGGTYTVNELRLGGRMSPSNTVWWDAIHASYSVDYVMLNGQLNSGIQN
jgi:hypothetical protein